MPQRKRGILLSSHGDRRNVPYAALVGLSIRRSGSLRLGKSHNITESTVRGVANPSPTLKPQVKVTNGSILVCRRRLTLSSGQHEVFTLAEETRAEGAGFHPIENNKENEYGFNGTERTLNEMFEDMQQRDEDEQSDGSARQGWPVLGRAPGHEK